MSHALQIQESRSVSLFPSEHEWAMLKEQAAMVVKTGFLPAAIKTPEQAIAIALKGRELGIPPMHAFAHIHIIQGKPTISAELMLALIFKNCPGAVIDYPETSSQVCVIQARRPGGRAACFRFTIEEARAAGLLNKDSWRNYPGAMLRARTVSIVARALFADAIMGCSYTPEELGADVNEEGEVINIPNEALPSPLPGPAVSPRPAVVIAPKSQDAAPPRMSKADLGKAIVRTAAAIKLSRQEMIDWIADLYKKPIDGLSMPELENFHGILEAERLAINEGDRS